VNELQAAFQRVVDQAQGRSGRAAPSPDPPRTVPLSSFPWPTETGRSSLHCGTRSGP
jgi:hypothetical protein